MKPISIHTVLRELKATIAADSITHELKARYWSGDNQGAIYFKPRVRWYQSQRLRDKQKQKNSYVSGNKFHTDSLMLFDDIKKRPFSIPRQAIIEFNGQKVIHE